ncbi:prolyl oligopeptidase family serine peptidase [Rhodobacter sp. SY28-1]|uniref:S9 family peptidase n=1 Tax=Rhodobacter sp. SY28-1 TaxID=2562317 RepID=UPI0010BFE731|nr:prolyl oligopeptidase family serine peptidase [Rhodobacter sp. SY28-1]
MTDLASLWAAVPQLSNIHASADGKWAFWCMSGVSETENVWCAPLDGSAPPRMLTNGQDHYLIRDVAPDGSRLVLAQSLNANEHDHLLLLDRETGALTQITPTQDTHYVYGGALSKDGAAIFFLADYDYGLNEVTQGAWLWRQDLATGKRTCLAQADSPPHFYIGPQLSPDGTRLLWHRSDRAPGGYQLWLVPVTGGEAIKVLDLGPTNNVLAAWLDDDRIGFACDHDQRDKLGILTLSSGAIDWRAGEPDLFPHSVLAGTGDDFLCIHHVESHTRAALVGPKGIRRLPNSSGRRSLLTHAALPNGGWLAEAYDADAPHDLVTIAADGTCQTIFRADPEPRRHHAAPQDFRWTAPDGRPMQGWLYRPDGPPKGLIGYVHGGPTWHSEDWVNPKIQFWVASGYAVLDPNYRGSTGFGYAHREAVKEDGWGGREQADIRSGLEEALAAGIHGPVAVAGNSYGGFSSWYAITRHADLVTAAIPMCGMYRLDIDYHATEMPHGRAYSEEMMGGTPEEFPEKYANASPGRFIDQIRGHVMIVHGLADSNVGRENTHAAVRDLTAARIPHEVLLFENEGHGVFRRKNVSSYLRKSVEFLEGAFRNGLRKSG